ncbi:MAG TPA: hypothetical protein VGG99_26775 [Acetobacteraceae bacterium]|jgi:hypothetical protein
MTEHRRSGDGDRPAKNTDAGVPNDRGTVERRIGTAHDRLPGQRNALRKGTLGGAPTMPQGDENRDPPPNAPTPPP